MLCSEELRKTALFMLIVTGNAGDLSPGAQRQFLHSHLGDNVNFVLTRTAPVGMAFKA